MTLTLLLFLPFVGCVIAALLPSNVHRLEAWLAGFVAVGCVLLLLAQLPLILDGQVVKLTLAWIPSMGIDFTLRLDGYAWLFALIIAGMGALIVLYARYYMSPQDPVPRFFSFFLLFMGAMLGVVLSGNLIQIVIFWELTSLSSFMLIAYWHHRLDARRGARMALIITGTGGFCLLGGVLVLGKVVGSYDLDAVFAAGAAVRTHPYYPVILVLIALGALTKSAQFPFHIWLPNAMAAPTPVSAYLHSATMVKAGVFLLARFWPVLAGTDEWAWIVGGAGLCSLVLGAYAATFQQDMKGVLAYSTISHLGLITLLLGLNSPLALMAALFHIVNHATFKASLFMAAGMVDHETGTRDMVRLSGLRHSMPITATLATVAAASMAGVPLLNGFISKEMFFSQAILAGNGYTSGDTSAWFLPIAAVVASSFSVAYSLRFILKVFFGKPAQDLPRSPHEPPRWMLVPSAILVLICLAVGMLPSATVGPFLHLALVSLLGDETPEYSLAIWHGFNLPMAMSFIALLGGAALLWLLRGQLRRRPGTTPIIYRLDGRRSFDTLLEWLDIAAAFVLNLLRSGRLQTQVFCILLVALLAAALSLQEQEWLIPDKLTPIEPGFVALWLAGALCAVGAAREAKYHRPASLLLAGGAGLVTCLTFAWLSAPDLALTQVAVEVVTIVLILLGLRWLPRRIVDDRAHERTLRTHARRARDFVLALAGGAGLSALAFAVLTHPADPGIASFFIEQSLPQGGGANVVNVILVDFRAFDTLGEITVLGIVALTVYALLRRFRPPPESLNLPLARQAQGTQPWQHDPMPETDPNAALPEGVMLIPAVLVRVLLPIAALVSVYFLLRGHNLPGGGFVAGLIFATAIVLQYVVGGVQWVELRARILPQYWLALGLLVAGTAATLVWWLNHPFLAAVTWDVILPGIGAAHLSSVLLFDIGVYMLVIGATILVLVALAHQSLRFVRRPVTPEEAA